MTDAATQAELTLAAEFPPYGEADWRALVDKVLKGGDFARRLVRTTADGIQVLPLYTRDDAPPPPGPPGTAPFTRGAAAMGAEAGGWDIRQLHRVGDPAATNSAILDDLEGGATSLQLRLDGPADIAALDWVLTDVLLDLAPIALEAGPAGAEAARALLALAERRDIAAAALRADLNLDPLGAAVAGAALDPEPAMAEAASLARQVASAWPGSVALLADGRPYHAGGASEAQELAFAVTTGIAYLRALVAEGLEIEVAAGQIGFALATDADFFLSLAKFRVLRRLWWRVLEVTGAVAAMPGLRLHAETATRMFTRVDPQVNILRGAVAAFAAAAGGAGSITVLPFDHALGAPAPLACRIARNTQLVLLEEAQLGWVQDPAGGSWFVERLTEELAAKAWALVQEIERVGGMADALRQGWPQAQVAASRARREADVASRREPIIGVSEFADLREPPQPGQPPAAGGGGTGSIAPIPAFRLADGFERLRARSDAILAASGERPKVYLCALGRQEEFAARAGFARNLFAAGGIATIGGEALPSLEEVGHSFRASGARQAAVCSSDANYATLAAPAARALKHAHAARVYLLGRPDEAQRGAWQAAGVDEFVHAGSDVLAVLERALAVETGVTA
jgi:methylmalonyl-CoA mutase